MRSSSKSRGELVPVAEAAKASDVAALLPLNPGGFRYGSSRAVEFLRI